MREKIKKLSIKIIILILTFTLASIASFYFIRERHTYDEIFPSKYLTEIRHISYYNSNLKNSYLDTPIYIFDSGNPGPSILYIGGTHPNEVAGILSSYTIIENVKIDTGRLFVIPVLNISGQATTPPGYAYPDTYSIGNRKFKVGGRLISPLDSWPDPAIYIHYPSSLALSYDEGRNLNRVYPGRHGNVGEEVGLAITNLLKEENISVAFDIHEASVTYPVNCTIVTPENGSDYAFLASMMLSEKNINIGVEISQDSNYGYSHREWGKNDITIPFLIEVPTPFIDRITGAMTETLIKGKDYFLPKVSDKGFTNIAYTEDGIDLDYRVGLQLTATKEILDVIALLNPELEISISFPTFDMTNKLGLEDLLNRSFDTPILKVR